MDEKTKKKLEQMKQLQALERKSRTLLSKTLATRKIQPKRKSKLAAWGDEE
jgi:hypothetical protein